MLTTSCPASSTAQGPAGPGGTDIMAATLEVEAAGRVYLGLQLEGTHEGRDGMLKAAWQQKLRGGRSMRH